MSVTNKEPYYLQNVQVTVYVPEGKTVITAKKYNRQINKNFHSSKRGIYINHHDRNVDEDYIFTHRSFQMQDQEDQNEKLKDAQEKLKETEEAQLELIKEKERELAEAKQKLDQDKSDQLKEIEELKNKK